MRMCAKQLTGIRKVYSIDCSRLLASLAQEHSPASAGHPGGREKAGGQSDVGIPAGEQNEYVSGRPGRRNVQGKCCLLLLVGALTPQKLSGMSHSKGREVEGLTSLMSPGSTAEGNFF